MLYITKRLGFIPINLDLFSIINLSLIFSLVWHRNNWNIFYAIFIFLLFYSLKFLINRKFERNDLIVIITSLFIYIIGGFSYNYQISNFNNFQNLTNDKTFDVIGKVTDISEMNHCYLKRCITLKLESLIDFETDKKIKTNNTVQLYVYNNYNIKVDDKIKVQDIKFKSLNKESQFKDYLIKEKISSTIFINTFNYSILERPKFSFKRKIHTIKTRLFNRLKNKFSKQTFSLFSSIFLGNKTAVKESLEDNKTLFQIWGLSHYLARAGLHLVIIIALWNLLISLIGIRFFIKQLLIFILIFIYYFFSWSNIPFIRALFVFTIYRICIIRGLQINSMHFLNLTCITILLFNPFQLFSLDFQLSFGLTYGLLLISYSNKFKKQNNLV